MQPLIAAVANRRVSHGPTRRPVTWGHTRIRRPLMISGLTSPGHGVRALLVATCVCAGVAYGQGPTVTARTLVHQFGPNGPAGSAIPGPFASVTTGARYSPSSVLVGLGDRRCFLADGASVRPVMVSGTQIPGQAPGVVWGGQFASAVWPIPGGAAFSAWASGPGIGDTARPRDRSCLSATSSNPALWTR